jgi:hypothetical protein
MEEEGVPFEQQATANLSTKIASNTPKLSWRLTKQQLQRNEILEPRIETTLSLFQGKTNSGQRQVERFTWSPCSPKKTFIAQEEFPDWLVLSLRACDWSEIGINQVQSSLLQVTCPQIFAHFGQQLKIIDESDMMTYLQTVDILLISGSTQFVEKVCTHSIATTPVITVLTNISRNRRRLVDWKQWTYKHSKVGGVTSCRVTIAFRGIQPIKLSKFVDRSLGHIIKHNVRPKPSLEWIDCVYRESSLLAPNDLERMIVYPSTHMTHTGWRK